MPKISSPSARNPRVEAAGEVDDERNWYAESTPATRVDDPRLVDYCPVDDYGVFPHSRSVVLPLIQPVIFVLLFAFVFGGAIPIPGAEPGSEGDPSLYREYLMPGIFGQTVAFAAAASTVGLAEAMQRGIIDRYRALPMSQPAVLIGNTFANARVRCSC